MSSTSDAAAKETDAQAKTRRQNELADRLFLFYGATTSPQTKQDLVAQIEAFQTRQGENPALDLNPFANQKGGDVAYRDAQFRAFVAPLFERFITGSGFSDDTARNDFWQEKVNEYQKCHGPTAIQQERLNLISKFNNPDELSLTEHWLTDNDLGAAKERLKRDGVDLFPERQDVLHVTTFDMMPQLFETLVKETEGKSSPQTHHLLINNGSIKGGGTHWTRAKVVINPNTHTFDIDYVDSLGNSDASGAETRLKTAFEEKLPQAGDGIAADYTLKDNKITASYAANQKDGWSCGYRAFYGALDAMARESGDSATVNEATRQAIQKHLKDRNLAAAEDDWSQKPNDKLQTSEPQRNAMFNLVLPQGWEKTLKTRQEDTNKKKLSEFKQQQAERAAKAVLGESIYAASTDLNDGQKTHLKTLLGAKALPTARRVYNRDTHVFRFECAIPYAQSAGAGKPPLQETYKTNLDVSTNGVQLPRLTQLPTHQEARDALAAKMAAAYVISQGGTLNAENKLENPDSIPPAKVETKDAALLEALHLKFAEMNIRFEKVDPPATIKPSNP